MAEFAFVSTGKSGVYATPGAVETIPEDLPGFLLAYYGEESAPLYLSGPVFEDGDPAHPYWHVWGLEVASMAYVVRKSDDGWEVV